MWWAALRDERGAAWPEYLILLLIMGLGMIPVAAGIYKALGSTHQQTVQKVIDIVTSGY